MVDSKRSNQIQLSSKKMQKILEDIYYDIAHTLSYLSKSRGDHLVIDDSGQKHLYSLKDFEKQRCIYIHIPKAAGISVAQALFGHNAGGHKTAKEHRKIFGRRYWQYFKFTFTRNPYSRLVSAYEYLRSGGHGAWPEDRRFAEEVLNQYKDFRDFVLGWLEPGKKSWPRPHFRPQTHFLLLHGRIAVDFLGAFERLEEDFAEVCARLDKSTTRSQEQDPRGTKTLGKLLRQRCRDTEGTGSL